MSRYYDLAIGGLVKFTGEQVCHKCEIGKMIPLDGDGYNWTLECYDENTVSGCGNIIHVSVNVSVEVTE